MDINKFDIFVLSIRKTIISRPRRSFKVQLKAKPVLEVLKGEKDILSNLLRNWRKSSWIMLLLSLMTKVKTRQMFYQYK